jgi:hypothetical protein
VPRPPDRHTPEAVTLTARSYETLAAGYPLTFPAPFAGDPGSEDFEYTWHLIQYAFDLPDPRAFPPFPHAPSAVEKSVLRRYCRAAQDLSESAFLRHPISLSVSLGDGIEASVNKEFPPSENVRGFSVLFRQFYSNDEAASFQSVQRLLRGMVRAQSDDDGGAREAYLRSWGRAVAKLRAHQLKVLVGRRLQRDGLWGPGELPGENESPQTLISVFSYGEDIHWGSQREALAAFDSDPFTGAWQRMNFFDSVAGLAHVFLGFSLLVESALDVELSH